MGVLLRDPIGPVTGQKRSFLLGAHIKCCKGKQQHGPIFSVETVSKESFILYAKKSSPWVWLSFIIWKVVQDLKELLVTASTGSTEHSDHTFSFPSQTYLDLDTKSKSLSLQVKWSIHWCSLPPVLHTQPFQLLSFLFSGLSMLTQKTKMSS